MESWFNNRLLVCHHFRHATQLPPGWFTSRFNTLVMCHLDIHMQNLVLDYDGNLWLLDWAFSGAYPPYFETANIMQYTPVELADYLLEQIGTHTQHEDIDGLMAIGFALTTAAYLQPSDIQKA
jgi:thiamine kinase-like enzyme